jgi:hypothetical protein
VAASVVQEDFPEFPPEERAAHLRELFSALDEAKSSLMEFVSTVGYKSSPMSENSSVWSEEIPLMGSMGSLQMNYLSALLWGGERGALQKEQHLEDLAILGRKISEYILAEGSLPWEEIENEKRWEDDLDGVAFLFRELDYLSRSTRFGWKSKNRGVPRELEAGRGGAPSFQETSPLRDRFLQEINSGIEKLEDTAGDRIFKNSKARHEKTKEEGLQKYLEELYDIFLVLNRKEFFSVRAGGIAYEKLRAYWKNEFKTSVKDAFDFWFVFRAFKGMQEESALWQYFEIFLRHSGPEGLATLLLSTGGHLRSVPFECIGTPPARSCFQVRRVRCAKRASMWNSFSTPCPFSCERPIPPTAPPCPFPWMRLRCSPRDCTCVTLSSVCWMPNCIWAPT